MPLYQWRAIDLTGSIINGLWYARSIHDLDTKLLHQECALLDSTAVIINKRTVPRSILHYFFKELSTLINAGIFLDHALKILIQQTKHRYFSYILADILADIEDGKYLHLALAQYPLVFNQLMVQMIQAGQESGKLSVALEQLFFYLESIEQFYKRLRSALLMPLITTIFFIGVALVIFIIIIPSFARMFQSTHQEIPAITKLILSINSVFTSSYLLVVIGILLLGVALILYMGKKIQRDFLDRLLIKLPLIGNIIKKLNLIYYLQSLSLLLQSHVHIISALVIAQQSLSNRYLAICLSSIKDKVTGGVNLSEACAQTQLFTTDVIRLIYVGQEVGQLGFIVQRASDRYKEQLSQLLFYLTSLLYPVIMIILGILIMGLIFAVYMPVFNISYIIN